MQSKASLIVSLQRIQCYLLIGGRGGIFGEPENLRTEIPFQNQWTT